MKTYGLDCKCPDPLTCERLGIMTVTGTNELGEPTTATATCPRWHRAKQTEQTAINAEVLYGAIARAREAASATEPEDARTYQPGCDCENPGDCERKGFVLVGEGQSARCKVYTRWVEELRTSAALNATRLSARFQARTFGNFQETPENAAIKRACMEWVRAHPKNPKGIGLTGNTGTGKTHLIAAIVNNLHARGHRVLFAAVPDLIADFRAGIATGESERRIQDAIAAPLLVLDDLGSGKATDYTVEVLERLVNARYEAMTPTLVTTNLLPQTIGEVISQRVASRLMEMLDWYSLGGADWRLKK